MKKITSTLILIICRIVFPQPSWAVVDSCRYPTDFTESTDFSCTSCESIGYKANGLYNSFTLACIDPKCVSAVTGATKCTKCADDHYVKGALCKVCPTGSICDGFSVVCPNGQYSSGGSCSACNTGCKTCKESPSSCLSCQEGYYTKSTYSNGTMSCSPCHYSCKSCSDYGTNKCTSCGIGQYLSLGMCVTCPTNAICDGSIRVFCKTGYSFNGIECVKKEAGTTVTVFSCPSRMTKSADGCCCLNK